MNEEQANPTQPPEPAGAPENPPPPSATPETNAEEKTDSHQPEIDLNPLFPGAENDLNALFPDQEMKQFLKSVSKNKKDLSALNERFIQENQRDETTEEDL